MIVLGVSVDVRVSIGAGVNSLNNVLEDPVIGGDPNSSGFLVNMELPPPLVI